MTKKSIDIDTILNRATPLVHQHAHEIQPYGHLVKMPIALSESACRESVENLNQLSTAARFIARLREKIADGLRVAEPLPVLTWRAR